MTVLKHKDTKDTKKRIFVSFPPAPGGGSGGSLYPVFFFVVFVSLC